MAKLPFGWLPAHWGVAGKTREIMLAEYYLKGYDLELQLLKINQGDYDIDAYHKKQLDIQRKYGKIVDSEYHRALVDLIKDEKQKALATLELDYKDKKLTDLQYQKQLATLNDEPWVSVLSMDFDTGNIKEGSFELDWNDLFVDQLRTSGYVGPTGDNIVNQWFMEVCRNVAMEEFDGQGDFTADSSANLDAVKRWAEPSRPLADGRRGYQ